jgi:toxin ParE1/3/4
MKFEFHPEAEEEFEAAKIFYQHHAGVQIAKAYVLEVRRIAQMLAEHPKYGRLVGSDLRSFALRRFPYSLIYQAATHGIVVMAVAHQHREPNYWRNRA